MKIHLLLGCVATMAVTRCLSAPALQTSYLDPIEMAAYGPIDGIAMEEYTRDKRSGSPDFLGAIKNKITQGLQKKLKFFGSASSSFSGGSGGSSGGGGGGGYHYDPPPTYDQKSFDWWTLKKSIFNTLFQAVKAIKGGVIAIKGQLIKGGGALISTKGKLISAKGEAIANLGRHIASSAMLSPPKGGAPSAHSVHSAHSAPSAPAAVAYPHSSGGSFSGSSGFHTAPSGPSASYGAPSAPAYHAAAAAAPSASGPSHSYGAPDSGYGAPAVTIPDSGYGAPSAPSGSFHSASTTAFGGPTNTYLPQKYDAAYEVTGKAPDGQASTGILIMKPLTSGLKLDMHHTGTVTLVGGPSGAASNNNVQHDPRQYGPPSKPADDKPEIPPFKNLPLKDQIPQSILQQFLGASGGLSSSSSASSGGDSGAETPDKPANSYGPPPAGDHLTAGGYGGVPPSATAHDSYSNQPSSHSYLPPGKDQPPPSGTGSVGHSYGPPSGSGSYGAPPAASSSYNPPSGGSSYNPPSSFVPPTGGPNPSYAAYGPPSNTGGKPLSSYNIQPSSSFSSPDKSPQSHPPLLDAPNLEQLSDTPTAFQSDNPPGPEPRPNFDVSHLGVSFADLLQAAESQLKDPKYANAQYIGPPPPSAGQLSQSPASVVEDPNAYPVTIPAYQLYKAMGHIQDANPLDQVTSFATKRRPHYVKTKHGYRYHRNPSGLKLRSRP